MVTSTHLEGALDGLVLAQVECVDELLDLGLPAPVLFLPPRQLSALVSERRVLVQRLPIHVPARQCVLLLPATLDAPSLCSQNKLSCGCCPHQSLSSEAA